MKISYDFFKSLLLINKRLTKKIFISKTEAKKGYSLAMFSKMYDCIFSELINLDREFKKYYSFEYNSIENFLRKKYNIKEKQLLELIN